MTNEETDGVIARAERSAWNDAFAAPIGSASMAGLFLIAALNSDAFTFWASISALFALIGMGGVAVNYNDFIAYKSNKAREIWKSLGRGKTFGTQLSEATRQLGNEVQGIYEDDLTGQLFPLRQAIRLLDTHHRQQARLQIVESRLRELRQLQESLAGKMEQLRELGEDYPQGARNLEQLNEDLTALGRVHGQIRGSCTRLEAIVIGVQKAVQSRQLRRELEGLSARVTPTNGPTEPAFESESLEEIERQIGREIETYLQLERETEEHLR